MQDDVLPNAKNVKGTGTITVSVVDYHCLLTAISISAIDSLCLSHGPWLHPGFLFGSVDRVGVALGYLETCRAVYQALQQHSLAASGHHALTCRRLVFMFKV